MFLFKKIFAPLFLPLSVIIALLLAGLFLVWFTRKQKTGKIVITMGVMLLIVFSYGFTSDRLLKPLEQRFPPLMIDSHPVVSGEVSSVKWIVLLGGGHTYDRDLPVTSHISEESLARLTETIRIYKRIRGSKILLSGGAVFDPHPEAKVLSSVAQILNVPSGDIFLDNDSRDTEEQALRIRTIVGRDPFVLVTSAYHMPRAVAIFKKQNMAPIPAPTNHMVRKRENIYPSDFYPSSMGLRKVEISVHEYLGLIWSKIRNKI
jgi:uncharacterized SAM-binding protein YcdF (DUF218 family)